MDALQAIEYLRNDPSGVLTGNSEWIEAGQWNGVCEILSKREDGKTTWTADDLNELLKAANSN